MNKVYRFSAIQTIISIRYHKIQRTTLTRISQVILPPIFLYRVNGVETLRKSYILDILLYIYVSVEI